MWTRPEDPTAAWYAIARELARAPHAVTMDMRSRHQPGPHQRCAGPHGADTAGWPCSTWHLAETADRIRAVNDC